MAQLGHTSKRTTAKNNKLTQKRNDFRLLPFDLSIVDRLFGMSFLLRRTVNWILYTFLFVTQWNAV